MRRLHPNPSPSKGGGDDQSSSSGWLRLPRSTRPPVAASSPQYPRRAEHAADAACDTSRRRFLGQLVLGPGLLGLGLPRLAHGQSMEVDLSRLDGHPHSSELAGAAAPPAQAEAMAAEPTPAPVVLRQELAAAPAPAPAAVEVTERRALWVAPGYLLLLEWRRPEDGTATIAALEGSATPVGDLLSQRVHSVDDLHHVDRLHAIELELVALLNGLVAPALVDVLHLDHDCSTVCSTLVGGTPPDYPDLLGIVAPVEWE